MSSQQLKCAQLHVHTLPTQRTYILQTTNWIAGSVAYVGASAVRTAWIPRCPVSDSSMLQGLIERNKYEVKANQNGFRTSRIVNPPISSLPQDLRNLNNPNTMIQQFSTRGSNEFPASGSIGQQLNHHPITPGDTTILPTGKKIKTTPEDRASPTADAGPYRHWQAPEDKSFDLLFHTNQIQNPSVSLNSDTIGVGVSLTLTALSSTLQPPAPYQARLSGGRLLPYDQPPSGCPNNQQR